MISSLLRIDPIAILRMIGNSRSGGEPVHVAGGDRGVVDDHTRGFDARATGRCADVVDGRRCGFRDRRDVVQQGDETTSHGNLHSSVDRATRGRGSTFKR